MRWIVLFLLLATSLFAQTAEPARIDAANSKLLVYAYKSGLFSFAGHNHVIAAPIANGTVNEQARTVELVVNVNQMQVLSPEESEKNRVEIRKTMLSDKLLDAEKFPTITFRSTSVKQVDANTAIVEGTLTLHGQSRKLSFPVKKQSEMYTGSTRLKQTDFGMKPVTVAAGTIKVKDEIKVDFQIRTESSSQLQ